MNKDLEQKLNNLKRIQPSNEWKSDLRNELFKEEESIFFQIVEPKLAFGSFALTGLVLALIVVGGYSQYPEVEMTQNRVTPRVMQVVEDMRDENQDQVGMMAMEEDDEEAQTGVMTADVDFSDLSEKEQRELVRKSTEELLEEINEVEERIARVLANQE